MLVTLRDQRFNTQNGSKLFHILQSQIYLYMAFTESNHVTFRTPLFRFLKDKVLKRNIFICSSVIIKE